MWLFVTRSLIKKKDKTITQELENSLETIFSEKWYDWKLYLWFPIINVDNSIYQLDALLVSKQLWVVVFSIVNNDATALRLDTEKERQKTIIRRLHNKFNMDEKLYDLEDWIKISIKAITYSTSDNKNLFDTQYDSKYLWIVKAKKYSFALNKEDLEWEIIDSKEMEDEQFERVISRIQDVINLNKTTYRTITKEWSKWDILSKIDKSISQLDPTQENAVVSFFDWVQRIRWLAGSWKTIILALKVAFYHTLRPHEKIAVTFYSKSLRQQFEELINIFCTSKLTKQPNWKNIDLIDARWWTKKEWIYHKLCYKYWKEFLNFYQARSRNDQRINHFEYACNKLLLELDDDEVIKEYDIIFIDEAQDLSSSFLKLCYMLLKDDENWSRRLIYAYDELQKLDEGKSLPSPKEIFGIDFVDTENQDLILKKCYRNSREVLTTAHCLWFGIYRNDWLVQFFKDKSLWSEIGYSYDWTLTPSDNVTIYRDEKTSPNYFEDFFDSSEFIESTMVENDEQQSDYIVQSIIYNIKHEDLLPNDIIIIYPDARPSPRNIIWLIQKKLFNWWIKTYFAWWDDDWIFAKEDHVTIAWIHKAKWNEKWMVYIVNWHSCYPKNDNWIELKKARNILFTAFTRSKAWVRIIWIWETMKKLCDEIESVRTNNYSLKFNYPTDEEIDNLDQIYWNNSKLNNSNKKKYYEIVDSIIEDINNGHDSINNYTDDKYLIDLINARTNSWYQKN